MSSMLTPLGLCELAIDVDEQLRRVGAKRTEDAGDLGLAIRREDKAVEHGRQRLWRSALGILQDELKTTRGAETRNGRWRERNDDGLWNGRELWSDILHDGTQSKFRRVPLVPLVPKRR